MKEKVLPYPCKCGGRLKKSRTEVEFFGINFGLKECEVCTKCGSEYLSNETMEEIEKEVKKKGYFALEKNVQIGKSGNSLVLRIPSEIAKFLHLHYKSLARVYPTGKDSLRIEVTN